MSATKIAFEVARLQSVANSESGRKKTITDANNDWVNDRSLSSIKEGDSE